MIHKTNQEIEVDFCSLSGYQRYTPDDLIRIANDMRQEGITGVEIDIEEGYYDSHSVRTTHYRMETDKERDKRILKQEREARERKELDDKRRRAQYELLKKEYGGK
jgi:hypothetical protein